MRENWQVIASRQVRRFPWFRPAPESTVLYDDVTERQARTLAAMLNRQDMGVTYQAQAKAEGDNGESR